VFGFVAVVVVVGAPAAPAAVEAPAVPRAKYFGSRFLAAKRGWSARRSGASGRVVIIYLAPLVVGLWGAHALSGAVAMPGGGVGQDARAVLLGGEDGV
jgi:hypothetical protein